MKLTTKDLSFLSVYAAIIYLGIEFFRIPTGSQFIHFGNALIATGLLLFGTKKGLIAATLALFIFDTTHGYIDEVWLTILETVLVGLVLHIVFQKLLKQKESSLSLFICSATAAVTKIILNLLKYTFYKGMLLGHLPIQTASIAALTKITGTFGSAFLTFVAVPLLYKVFKRILTQVNYEK